MRKTSNITCSVLVLATLWGAPQADAAVNLVANGGFETGQFDPEWVEFGQLNFLGPNEPDPVASPTVEGTWQASFGPFDETNGIEQTLTTVPTISYKLTFYLRNEAGDFDPRTGPNNYFLVEWNGNDFAPALEDSLSFSYQAFTYVFTADSANTTLRFTFQNDEGFFDLDAVSVEEVRENVVPEPTSLAAWSLAALGLGILRRRNRKVAA